jgi:hypothetical protein
MPNFSEEDYYCMTTSKVFEAMDSSQGLLSFERNFFRSLEDF